MKRNYYDTPMGRANMRAIIAAIMGRVIKNLEDDYHAKQRQARNNLIDFIFRQPDENNNG